MDLLAASKLVRREHIDEAIRLLRENDADGFNWLYEQTGRREPDSRYVVFDGVRYPTKALGFLVAQIAGGIDSRDNDLNVNQAAAPLLRHGGVEVRRNQSIAMPNQEESRQASYYRTLARPQQARFRAAVVASYRRCAVSGVSASAAVEAAHVKEFARRGLNTLSNGILLRCDLHGLFDAGDMAVDPDTMTIHFSATCLADYEALEGGKVKIPTGGPDASDFRDRWEAFSKADVGGGAPRRRYSAGRF